MASSKLTSLLSLSLLVLGLGGGGCDVDDGDSEADLEAEEDAFEDVGESEAAISSGVNLEMAKWSCLSQNKIWIAATNACVAPNPPADACWKQSETRGVGQVPNACPAGKERVGLLCYAPGDYPNNPKPSVCGPGLVAHQGLCYEPCPEGMVGIGPVCWDACPDSLPSDCGMSCTADAAACANRTMKQVASVIAAAGTTAAGGVPDVGAIAESYGIPVCGD